MAFLSRPWSSRYPKKTFLSLLLFHKGTATAIPNHSHSRLDYSEVERVCTVLEQQQFSSDTKLRRLLGNISLSHEFVLSVLNRFLRERRPAWRFYLWAATQTEVGYSHSTITSNKMIDILGKTRDYRTIWEVLRQMGTSGLLTVKTLEVSVKALADGGQVKGALRVFDLMTHHGVHVDVEGLNFVLDSLCRVRLGNEGHEIFRKVKRMISPNDTTYGLVLCGLCKVNNLVQAMKVWNEMLDKGMKSHVTVCNTMLEALLKGKRYPDAFKLFHFISVIANAKSYAIMIDALCKNNKIRQALRLFDEMREYGLAPDGVVYKSLITGLGNAMRLDEAYRMLEEMGKPDTGPYNALIKVMVNLCRPDEANRLFHRMIQDGCEPIMHTYVMLMQVNFGFRRCSEVLCPNVDFHTVFVGGLVKKGRSREASKYLESMVYEGVDVPRFDYNRFLSDFSSTPDGHNIFEEVAEKLRQAGKVDLSDVFLRYSQKMTTRDKRRVVRSSQIG